MEFTEDQISSLSLVACAKNIKLFDSSGMLKISGHPMDLKRRFPTELQFFERLAHYQENGKIETEY